MGIYDAMMLAIVIAAVLWGAFKGLAWQIASLAAIFLSYLVAVNFRGSVAEHIDAEPPWNTFAAMLILYLGTSLVIWIMFRVVRESIEGLKLKSFDRQLGALFGGVKGVAIATVVTFFGLTLLTQAQQQAIIHSQSGYYIAKVLDGARLVMPDELHAVLGPYIDQMDEKLEGGTYAPQPGVFPTSPNIAMDPFGQPPANSGQPSSGGYVPPSASANGWTTPPRNPSYAQPNYSQPAQGNLQPGYQPNSGYAPQPMPRPTTSQPAPPYGSQPGYAPRSAQPTYRPAPY